MVSAREGIVRVALGRKAASASASLASWEEDLVDRNFRFSREGSSAYFDILCFCCIFGLHDQRLDIIYDSLSDVVKSFVAEIFSKDSKHVIDESGASYAVQPVEDHVRLIARCKLLVGLGDLALVLHLAVGAEQAVLLGVHQLVVEVGVGYSRRIVRFLSLIVSLMGYSRRFYPCPGPYQLPDIVEAETSRLYFPLKNRWAVMADVLQEGVYVTCLNCRSLALGIIVNNASIDSGFLVPLLGDERSPLVMFPDVGEKHALPTVKLGFGDFVIRSDFKILNRFWFHRSYFFCHCREGGLTHLFRRERSGEVDPLERVSGGWTKTLLFNVGPFGFSTARPPPKSTLTPFPMETT